MTEFGGGAYQASPMTAIPGFERFVQVASWHGQIYAEMCGGAKHNHLRCEVIRLVYLGSGKIDVYYRRDGMEHRIVADHVVSTIPLAQKRQKSANTTRSKVRTRVEHVFGHQQSSMGGKIVRTIGIARARFKIGMTNLGYNIRRLVCARLSALTGGLRVGSCKRTARSPASVKTVPDPGTHLGTSAATARSAKAEIAESGYCSRCP